MCGDRVMYPKRPSYISFQASLFCKEGDSVVKEFRIQGGKNCRLGFGIKGKD